MRLIDYCLFYLMIHWSRFVYMASAIVLMMPEVHTC